MSPNISRTARRGGLLLSAVLLAACGPQADGGNSAKDLAQLQIKVLSNRADLVSGGDALVEIQLPSGKSGAALKADVNGRDVSSALALRPNGRVMGLITDLKEGRNLLSVAIPGGLVAQIELVNFPNGGPVFAGEQIQPWPCLAGAVDQQCNRPVSYEYFYMPAALAALPGGNSSPTAGSSSPFFQPYDPANPPSDVATTTTDQGHTVPYIVRVENGSQDRGKYKMAVLFDPAKSWAPWEPQIGWNGKTYVTGGSGCGTHHGETEAPGVLDDNALSRGFMVWSTALDHNTQNCNLAVQAESLMMAKERITEQYGPIRYTIGSGCSGGSIYQQQVANAYPGIFDGILPNCSFPDSFSTAIEVIECGLLVNYFDTPSMWGTGVAWTEPQQAAVMGHPGINICQSWVNVYAFDRGANPRQDSGPTGLDLQSCNIPKDQAYDPKTNPGGPRCSLTDYLVSILGRRPQDGFANNPLDNVGVQYGLGALQSGLITPAQFVDLNARVGGRDIDYNLIPQRSAADIAGLTATYRAGLSNYGNNMGRVAIIDLRGHDVAEIHHDYRSYVMRARLDRSQGHHENQVIWTGSVPLVGDAQFPAQALTVMDSWLAAVEADQSERPLEEKIVLDRPATAHDLCTDGAGNEIPNATVCAVLNPYYSEPRMVAGEPFTGDTFKCQLKPLDRSEYTQAIAFTDAEWTALQAAFPDGVCDWSKPGVEQQPTIPWQTYAEGPGGKALPQPASSRALDASGAKDVSCYGGALSLWPLLLALFAVSARRKLANRILSSGRRGLLQYVV